VKLTIQTLAIPFKYSFSHASATRMETESVLIKAITNDGIVGYGEGCPRSYVTGETLASVIGFFEAFQNDFMQLDNLESVVNWQEQHTDQINQNPAAWCAVECALLDALSRSSDCSIEAFLSLTKLTGIFNYSAVLGAEHMKTFTTSMAMYQQFRFTDYKLKISGNLKLDQQKVSTLLTDTEYRLRLDGNNLWQDVNTATAYIHTLNAEFIGIEEPLVAKDFASMRRLYEATGSRIILDESFLSMADFDAIATNPECWIINLRVSKMGGILRSLKVAEQATKMGIGLIIGAQVGETSILTRAALTVAAQYNDYLIAQEGAFGSHFLKHDITNDPIIFGLKGQLNVDKYATLPGFGLQYNL